MESQEVRPSEVLWKLRSEHPDATNPQLADVFLQQFPNVRSTAKRVIWRWRGSGDETSYFSDEQIDVLLGEIMRDAGYLR